MRSQLKKYITVNHGFLVLFLLLSGQSFPQQKNSTGKREQSVSAAEKDFRFTKEITTDTVSARNGKIRISKDISSTFLDSLKIRSSRNIVTRKLYDILIIPPANELTNEISESNEEEFIKYTGKTIRTIEIRQLDVFGSSIVNPESTEPDRFEKMLNRTHANTRESIIRKNLLFKVNDTVSALTFTDNERIIRQLPYINDARIIVREISDYEVDVIVLTRDIYSIGLTGGFEGFDKWNLTAFDRNMFGTGHEFSVGLRNDADLKDNPGVNFAYRINNIRRSFINADFFFADGLGRKMFGINLDRSFISSETKYAGGVSLKRVFTTEDLDTLDSPEPLRYNLQDYWIGRSLLLNRNNVTRIFAGLRYTNNNVYDRPFILPDSYYHLQKYNLYLGSLSLSTQKYYQTSLLYSYGKTEDIPHGSLAGITAGIEDNEFKRRYYGGINLSLGASITRVGYFYTSTGIASFFNRGNTEQGIFYIRSTYISNLTDLGKNRLRNFVRADYTRGFDRYIDEFLVYDRTDGFSGFRNDSVNGQQRLSVSLESVLFTPGNYYGFRFALFGFSEIGFLFGSSESAFNGTTLSSIGLGVRIRNDNLLFNTFQIRLGIFPNLPSGSSISNFLVSGEKSLRPVNFEPGMPSVLPYR